MSCHTPRICRDEYQNEHTCNEKALQDDTSILCHSLDRCAPQDHCLLSC